MVDLGLKQATISIHAPREGGDSHLTMAVKYDIIFQSTPPARGATYALSRQTYQRVFQSTPPARGATATGDDDDEEGLISIHAPREGGDVYGVVRDCYPLIISIHAPREGGDVPDLR